MRDARRFKAIVRDLIEQERSICETFSSSLNRWVNQFDEYQRSLVEALMPMDYPVLVESRVPSVVHHVERVERLVNDINQHFENMRKDSLLAKDRLVYVRWETIASEDILDLFPGPMADESLLFHEESSVETTVTYTLEREGRLIVVENVPARVDTETGEQSFSPQTEERLQEIDRGGMKPARVIEARVFDFAQSTSKPRQHLKVVRRRHLRGQGD